MSKPKFIVFEGLDSSFKETNAKKLVDFINNFQTENNKAYKALLLSFPNYDSPSSYFVKENLAGKYDFKNDFKDAYVTSIMYAMDRFDTFQKENFSGYDFIILDRYYTSNMIYQCAKLGNQFDIESLCKKIIKFETKYLGLPKVDKVFYMHNKFGLIEQLLLEKDNKDIYEKDIDYLYDVYKMGTRLVIQENWDLIECSSHEGVLLSEEEIFHQIKTEFLYYLNCEFKLLEEKDDDNYEQK